MSTWRGRTRREGCSSSTRIRQTDRAPPLGRGSGSEGQRERSRERMSRPPAPIALARVVDVLTQDGREKRQQAFVAALSSGAPVESAAPQAGVSVKTLYQWRKSEQEFRKAWEEAYDAGTG